MSTAIQLTQALEQAQHQLAQVTRLKPVTAIRAFKDEQGWHVSVEMLEMTRVPDSTDLLGRYEVVLDQDGSMVRFERRLTRLRGETVRDDSEYDMAPGAARMAS